MKKYLLNSNQQLLKLQEERVHLQKLQLPLKVPQQKEHLVELHLKKIFLLKKKKLRHH
jgi:hypothetical protein